MLISRDSRTLAEELATLRRTAQIGAIGGLVSLACCVFLGSLINLVAVAWCVFVTTDASRRYVAGFGRLVDDLREERRAAAVPQPSFLRAVGISLEGRYILLDDDRTLPIVCMLDAVGRETEHPDECVVAIFERPDGTFGGHDVREFEAADMIIRRVS